MLDFGLYLFYALLFIAVAGAIIFPIINAMKTPGALVRSLIGVVILVVLFGISYALSGSAVSDKNAALGVTETSSKLIGAGLIMFYITLILSAVALFYSEITKAFK
jgi:hypothetical protein